MAIFFLLILDFWPFNISVGVLHYSQEKENCLSADGLTITFWFPSCLQTPQSSLHNIAPAIFAMEIMMSVMTMVTAMAMMVMTMVMVMVMLMTLRVHH